MITSQEIYGFTKKVWHVGRRVRGSEIIGLTFLLQNLPSQTIIMRLQK